MVAVPMAYSVISTFQIFAETTDVWIGLSGITFLGDSECLWTFPEGIHDFPSTNEIDSLWGCPFARMIARPPCERHRREPPLTD
jgi:hypothetical protein